MATPVLIDITNFDTLLVESTQSRTGTPDGNIFFDNANDSIELITAEDLANVDLGSGAEANPLTDDLGITMQALYAFERQQRNSNVALRTFRHGAEGRFKQAGAFAFVNGIKLDDVNGTTADRLKVRLSGFTEYAGTGNGETSIDRVYFNPRSLNAIDSASQPYYLLPSDLTEANRQSAAPTNFNRTGPIDEVVQVFGDTAFGDAGAGNFDYTARPLVIAVRPFNRTYGETNSTAAGIAALAGFSAGLGIGDDVNDFNNYTQADVFGGGAISPFTGVTYEAFGAPQNKTGFTDGAADFSVVISNTASGSLQQILAKLDAIMIQDTDQDAGAGSYLPKRGAPLYSKNSAGQYVTKTGVFIDNVPTADRQLIVQTDDNGAAHVYPFYPTLRINVSDAWQADPNGWCQVMYTDGAGSSDFDTATAVIVDDSGGSDMVFTSADAIGSSGAYYLEAAYDYDANTQAGLSAGVDKDMTVLVEGDGGAEAERGAVTITRDTLVTVSVLPKAETNL